MWAYEHSIGGVSYFITFIDDKSRRVEVHFLKTKNKAKEVFKKFKAFVENQKEGKIKVLRTDNGLEYCDKNFVENLKSCGIKRECTVAYTSQQNGTAECINRILIERA